MEALLFTVFTPTFNRAHLLDRVYQSLRRQSEKNFEWLIIDDGSADNTGQMVAQWMKEANFPIRYYYQVNSGKHVAINRAVSMAEGHLFVIVDSDDWLAPNALARIGEAWHAIPLKERTRFAGIAGLFSYPCGKIVGTLFPRNGMDSDALEIRTKYRVRGDKFEVYRVEVLREYPFPENLGRFVTEALVWNRIAQRYSMRFFNEVWAYKEYQPDGLSSRYVFHLIASPQGARLYYKELLQYSFLRYMPMLDSIKACANYVRFSLHGKVSLKNLLEEMPRKDLSPLGLPLGVVLWARDVWSLLKSRD